MANSYANLLEQRKLLYRKKVNLPWEGLVWNTNMAAVSLFRNTNMAEHDIMRKCFIDFASLLTERLLQWYDYTGLVDITQTQTLYFYVRPPP